MADRTVSDKGVYRLAGAILLQAIQDATSSSMGKRAGALRWMRNNSEASYSFPFICRILNRNPEEVRQYCERKIAERRNGDSYFRGSTVQ